VILLVNEENLRAPDFKGALTAIEQALVKLKENQQKTEQAISSFEQIKGKIKEELSDKNFAKISESLESAKSAIEEGKENVVLFKGVMETVKRDISEIEKIYGVKTEIQDQILAPVSKTIQIESTKGMKETKTTAIYSTIISVVVSVVIAIISFQISNKSTIASTNEMLTTINEKNIQASNYIASSGNLIVERIGKKYEEVSGRLENSIKRNNLLTELLRLQTQALGGSKVALEEIIQYAGNPNFPFQNEADKIQLQIRQHCSTKAFFSDYSFPIVDWKKIGLEKTAVGSFTFEQLRKKYLEFSKEAQTKTLIPNAMCDYILHKRNDFSIDDKTRFAIEIIDNDLNLSSIVSAQRFLIQTYDLKEYSFDFKGWVSLGKEKFKERFPNLSLDYASPTSQIATSSFTLPEGK